MPIAKIDDLRMYYEQSGRGDPEILFIPGWCSDVSAFRPQFDYFGASHRVTALDLRGCGRSDATSDGYRVSELANDVASFCRVVGIEQAIVVGHSLGGMIALELGAHHPGIPRAVVLVDPGPIDPSPATVEFYDSFAAQLAGSDGETIRRRYVEDMAAVDPELARRIADMMCRVPLESATAVIRHLTSWEGRDALTKCAVPILLTRSRFRDGPDSEDIRLRAIQPELTLGMTVGAGHFHQLEVPSQINAMIHRFLEIFDS
jgi:pimeloyl-ACP methyl ester carboxylesterase